MTIEDAMKTFKIMNKDELNEDNIKKIYRELCFLYHPDAHLSEDSQKYTEIISQINAAYDVLKQYITRINSKNSYVQKQQREKQEQTEKEKILMDIIVKSYYASKAEIDKINADFLDYFLSVPSKTGKVRVASYRYIGEAFNNKAANESEVMNKYIKKFALEFANKYGIEINFMEVMTGEYINFLNRTNWYDKYCNYKENEEKSSRKLT